MRAQTAAAAAADGSPVSPRRRAARTHAVGELRYIAIARRRTLNFVQHNFFVNSRSSDRCTAEESLLCWHRNYRIVPRASTVSVQFRVQCSVRCGCLRGAATSSRSTSSRSASSRSARCSAHCATLACESLLHLVHFRNSAVYLSMSFVSWCRLADEHCIWSLLRSA